MVNAQSSVTKRYLLLIVNVLLSTYSNWKFEFCKEVILIEIHHLFQHFLFVITLRTLFPVLTHFCLSLVGIIGSWLWLLEIMSGELGATLLCRSF